MQDNRITVKARGLIIKLIIWAIRKYAPEGIGAIDGPDGVIAYRWAWSKALEHELKHKTSVRRR